MGSEPDDGSAARSLKYISKPVSGVLALSWSGLDTLVSSEARCSSQRLLFFLVVVFFALLPCIILPGPRVSRGLLCFFSVGGPRQLFWTPSRQSSVNRSCPWFTPWIPRLLSGDVSAATQRVQGNDQLAPPSPRASSRLTSRLPPPPLPNSPSNQTQPSRHQLRLRPERT